MSTQLRNLNADAQYKGASNWVVGITSAKWNAEITDNLLKGAVDVLIGKGIKQENLHILRPPGAFELPVTAQWLIEKGCSGVVALGSVIRGETPHFDFVCSGTTQGLVEVSLKFNVPVIYGLLTDNTWQQAKDRSGGALGNKGEECALALLEMLSLKGE
jgi:6,7-dimethyl-8-ribityllumazine synthase